MSSSGRNPANDNLQSDRLNAGWILQRMKILFTVHQFFPDYTAGTEVLTLSVAKELLRRGYEVRVYTANPSEKFLPENERFDQYEFDGIPIYRFHHAYVPMAGQTSRIEIGYDNCLAATHFETILKSYQPDLVHFFHLNRLGTRLIEKADSAGIPTFMTITDFWAICPTGQLLLSDGKLCNGPNQYAGNCVKHLAERNQKGLSAMAAKWMPVDWVNWIARLACSGLLLENQSFSEVKAICARLGTNASRLGRLKKIFAPSKIMRDLLIMNGVDPDLIIELAYGVDGIDSHPTPKPGIPSRPYRIGYIGTLAHYKGCHVLIEAFKTLAPGHAVLKIYGSPYDFPGYSSELHGLASGQSDIKFCGTFPYSGITEILAGLDALVVPSLWYENTPLVIYSAQAAHCPVVASKVPGISEVINDEENGLLFEAGEPAGLTRQLLRLICEPGVAARLSVNARKPKSTTRYVDELLNYWNLFGGKFISSSGSRWIASLRR